MFRGKLKKGNKLSASADAKVWKINIKNIIADLGASLEETKKIIDQLTKLRNACIKTQDNLTNEVLAIEVELQKRIEQKQIKL